MNVVHPVHSLRLLDAGDVEIHDHRFLPAAAKHTRQWLDIGSVDLLVRHEWRHMNEITRAGFGNEFQIITPAHARLAAHQVDDALDRDDPVRSRIQALGLSHAP